MNVTYQYDTVGNVKVIDEAGGATYDQSFAGLKKLASRGAIWYLRDNPFLFSGTHQIVQNLASNTCISTRAGQSAKEQKRNRVPGAISVIFYQSRALLTTRWIG